MPGPATSSADRSNRRDLALAVGVGVLFLVLYATTASPTVYWYDSAEYAAAAATLGIPHPPGYPLYTLVGRLFAFLPGEPARAINLMSATFGAATVGLIYPLVRRLGARPMAALWAAALLGSGRLFWGQCVVAEVYTLALAVLVLVVLALLTGARSASWRWVLGGSILAGAGLGAHYFVATCGLGFALLVWHAGRPRQGAPGIAGRARIAALSIAGVIAGACILLWVPLRAAMKPAVDAWRPERGAPWHWFASGGNYKTWFTDDMDLAHRATDLQALYQDQLSWAGVLLAALGAMALLRRRPVAGSALLLAAAGNTWFFFDYGAWDWPVFFLPTVLLLCVLAGLGVEFLLRALEQGLPVGRARPATWTAVAILALIPLLTARTSHEVCDLSDFEDAQTYGRGLCEQLPQGAALVHFSSIQEWGFSAVFEFYYQGALGQRPDVHVIANPTADLVADHLQRSVPVFVLLEQAGQVEALQGLELERQGLLWQVVTPEPAG